MPLQRSANDVMIGGVCGGLAEWLGWDPTLVRILYVVVSVLSAAFRPGCTATSKRTRERCRAPAVNGWTVCRFHGAGSGVPKVIHYGQYRHGLYNQEAIAERRAVTALLRQVRHTIGSKE